MAKEYASILVDKHSRKTRSVAGSRTRVKTARRRFLVGGLALLGVVTFLVAAGGWLGAKASVIESELTAVTSLIPVLRVQVVSDDATGAAATVAEMRNHTAAAKKAADDPLWTLASALPGAGSNFGAIAEVARSADDVAAMALTPLVGVYSTLDWEALLPSSSGTNLDSLMDASPSLSAAAHAVSLSEDRLSRIEASDLLPAVAGPLNSARRELQYLTGTLNAAADAAEVAPGMLGAQAPRNYLLLIQNSAEVRSSGGLPGALAILTLDKGKLTLGAQTTATAVGAMSPIIPVDVVQQQIYSSRIGRYMHDVNLTPDFPTSASTAQAMWERKTGQRVDGVISVDPVVLGYILDATGPVRITDPQFVNLADTGLPSELSGKNVVRTLLSDVYAFIEQPAMQDAYFAGVAQQVFAALSEGKGDAKGIMDALTRATGEGRVLVWSGAAGEQSIISSYSISGSISGPSVAPAQFGVYFNDGTGAKMDYHVKRSVQLIQHCTTGEDSAVTVRITSTNLAPSDAATSLPPYVTGGKAVGIEAGTVQTNVAAYGPVQAHLAGAKKDGNDVPVSSHRHDGRPVGMTTVTLAPGETSIIDMQFDKIVQHAPPTLRVTPTVRNTKDVILETELENCSADK